jgi:hypothetical protein
MKNDRSNHNRKRIALMLMLLGGSSAGLFGCSMATTSAEWAEPEDLGGEFSVIDDSERQWSKRVEQLPVELHGAWPGASAAETAALVPRANSADNADANDANAAQQRVVVYVSGTQVPQRADFCAINKSYRAVANDRQVTLRAALCDGPRIISYARKSFDGDSKLAATDVASLESSLVGALHPPFNFLDVDD